MARRDMSKTIAIRASEVARKAWITHARGCAACHGAVRDLAPKRICDEGWPLASAATRTTVELDQLREARAAESAVQQPALF